jgi:uncharacterized protein YndB with AHSA1/START domain
MTQCQIVHSDIRLTRHYTATPAKVFSAWSQAEKLLQWGSPGTDWHAAYEVFDFRVGGRNVCRFGPNGGETYKVTDQYEDIVPDQRIVMLSNMMRDENRLFVGLVTLEFRVAGAGCDFAFSELGVFLDGHDRPENHRMGWEHMLDNLEHSLDGSSS